MYIFERHTIIKIFYNFLEDINTAFQKFSEIKDVNNMNEEIKQSVIKYISFLACMLEKQNMVTICDNYYTIIIDIL